MDQVFAPLHAALMQNTYTAGDVFEFIGASIDYPDIAKALCAHASDFVRERGETAFDYSELLSEVYRRAFFDAAHAAKYGTEEIAGRPDDERRAFAQYMIDGLSGDRAQEAAKSFPQPSTHTH